MYVGKMYCELGYINKKRCLHSLLLIKVDQNIPQSHFIPRDVKMSLKWDGNPSSGNTGRKVPFKLNVQVPASCLLIKWEE